MNSDHTEKVKERKYALFILDSMGKTSRGSCYKIGLSCCILQAHRDLPFIYKKSWLDIVLR